MTEERDFKSCVIKNTGRCYNRYIKPFFFGLLMIITYIIGVVTICYIGGLITSMPFISVAYYSIIFLLICNIFYEYIFKENTILFAIYYGIRNAFIYCIFGVWLFIELCLWLMCNIIPGFLFGVIIVFGAWKYAMGPLLDSLMGFSPNSLLSGLIFLYGVAIGLIIVFLLVIASHILSICLGCNKFLTDFDKSMDNVYERLMKR